MCLPKGEQECIFCSKPGMKSYPALSSLRFLCDIISAHQVSRHHFTSTILALFLSSLSHINFLSSLLMCWLNTASRKRGLPASLIQVCSLLAGGAEAVLPLQLLAADHPHPMLPTADVLHTAVPTALCRHCCPAAALIPFASCSCCCIPTRSQQ